MKRVTFSFKLFVIGILFSLVSVFSCSNENSDWVKTKTSSTQEAYMEFIEKYPNSIKLDSAYICLDSLRFYEVIEKDSISALEEFIIKYPDSKYIEEVEIVLDSMRYKKVISTLNLDSLTVFLKNYPDSRYIDHVKMKLDSMRYKKVISTLNLDSLTVFLKNYPDSRYIDHVKMKLDSLRYKKVILTSNLNSLSAFLKKYPDSKFVGNVKFEIDKIRHAEQFNNLIETPGKIKILNTALISEKTPFITQMRIVNNRTIEEVEKLKPNEGYVFFIIEYLYTDQQIDPSYFYITEKNTALVLSDCTELHPYFKGSFSGDPNYDTAWSYILTGKSYEGKGKVEILFIVDKKKLGIAKLKVHDYIKTIKIE